jgi:hypothetical protein
VATFIDNIEPDQFALLVSLVAIAISDGLTGDENTSLGTFITAVGDTVVLIGAQQTLIADRLKKTDNSQGGEV